MKGRRRGWQNGRVCDEGCAVRGAKQNGERRKGNDWGNVQYGCHCALRPPIHLLGQDWSCHPPTSPFTKEKMRTDSGEMRLGGSKGRVQCTRAQEDPVRGAR